MNAGKTIFSQIMDYLPLQQFSFASSYHRGTLQVPMADRIVFSMDQTTSAHQILLWDLGKRGEDSNLDSYLCLCPGGDNQKEAEFRDEPLHFFANPYRNGFRENSDFTST
jgi:hypothetical protein